MSSATDSQRLSVNPPTRLTAKESDNGRDLFSTGNPIQRALARNKLITHQLQIH